MTVFEMAERYYPRLWGMTRLEVLVRAGRLTAEEKERLVRAQRGEHEERGDIDAGPEPDRGAGGPHREQPGEVQH